MTNKILIILVIMLMFMTINIINAEQFNTIKENSNNLYLDESNISKYSSINSKNNTVISGKVINCNNTFPFKGANIYIKSLSGDVLAYAVSNANGYYKTSFYSPNLKFNVIATYPGHIYSNKVITISNSDKNRHKTVNLRLGTLNLIKGSTDILAFDSNKFYEGPDKHTLQIKIKNNAITTATNIWINLNWTGNNQLITLDPSETSSKFVGNISPGNTTNIFFLIDMDKSITHGMNRTYIITANGSNTDSIDNITGNFIATAANSQNRNRIDYVVISNNNPVVGSFINLTVKSSTSSSGFVWVNLQVIYNPAILKLVKVNNTYGSNKSTTDLYIPTPGTNTFITLWTFEVIGIGNSDIIAWILDSSGVSFHYNMQKLISAVQTKQTDKIIDLAIFNSVNNTYPHLGDSVAFTITVTNNGLHNATNVYVIDMIPSGLEYINSHSTVASYNSFTGIWTIGDLNTHDTVSLTIIVKITDLSEIINTANVTADQEDFNISNNEANASVKVLNDRIRTFFVLNTSNNANVTNILLGNLIKFTVTVTNIGNGLAFNVSVNDLLPQGLSLISFNSNVGVYDSSVGIWIIGNIAPYQTATLTIITKAIKIGRFTNTAIFFVNGSNYSKKEAIILVSDFTPSNPEKIENNNENNTQNDLSNIMYQGRLSVETDNLTPLNTENIENNYKENIQNNVTTVIQPTNTKKVDKTNITTNKPNTTASAKNISMIKATLPITLLIVAIFTVLGTTLARIKK